MILRAQPPQIRMMEAFCSVWFSPRTEGHTYCTAPAGDALRVKAQGVGETGEDHTDIFLQAFGRRKCSWEFNFLKRVNMHELNHAILTDYGEKNYIVNPYSVEGNRLDAGPSDIKKQILCV